MVFEPPHSPSLVPFPISQNPSQLATGSTHETGSIATSTTLSNDLIFVPHYGFPPFFTLQRNATSRASQLFNWSTQIQAYCRHHHLFSLSLIDAIPTPLFRNSTLNKALSLRDAYFVLAWMSTPEGGRRAEFVDASEQAFASKLDFSQRPEGGTPSAAGKNRSGGGKVYIYWRRPEEWADMLASWADNTGQKNSVLTLYELTESEAVQKEEWRGMDAELLRKSLNVLVKKGKAQVFGLGQELGVKFS